MQDFGSVQRDFVGVARKPIEDGIREPLAAPARAMLESGGTARRQMPYARLGDINIHYDVADYTDPWRRSDTVLLHHGFGRNLEFWRAWVPLLARDYRVVRLDARGCGRSGVPPPGSPYTLDMMVADAIGLMDHLGIERVHWGAEASGGHVGLATAIAHPAGNRVQRARGLYPAQVRLVSTQDELRAQLRDADAMVTESLMIGRPELEIAGRLRVVHKYGTVLRNIDAAACAERGVKVLKVRRRANIEELSIARGFSR